MQDYETRIITAAGKTALISSARFMSDFVAIRAAQKMCRDGEVAEVWRGEFCVYGGCHSTAKSSQG